MAQSYVDRAATGVGAVAKMAAERRLAKYYIHLYSPRNMVAQANKTASKNTTNEKEKNIITIRLYTHINRVQCTTDYVTFVTTPLQWYEQWYELLERKAWATIRTLCVVVNDQR